MKDKPMGFCVGRPLSSLIPLIALALLGLTDAARGTKIQNCGAGRMEDKGLGLRNIFKRTH